MTGQARGELRVLATGEALEEALADSFVAAARESIAQHRRFYVALAGGTTPKAAYALLAGDARREFVEWQRSFIYFSDERCVPPENDESNYKMAFESLLDKVPIPPANVHRMHGEDEPARAARAYENVLRETMGGEPRFDLMLLGMGPDGHTASLFPSSDPAADDGRFVREIFVEKLGVYRLTLTPRVINNSRHVVIALAGANKAPVLKAVREGPYDPSAHPVQIVAPHDGTLTWLVDREASQLLSS